MGDLSDEEKSSKSCSNGSVVTSAERVMTCVNCGTTKTPLWRTGPTGPKSLCNACGIKYQKKRLLVGRKKASVQHKTPKKISSNRILRNNNDNGKKSNLGDSTEHKFLAFRIPITWQNRKARRKLGEEVRAAMLLMALSCGSVYA